MTGRHVENSPETIVYLCRCCSIFCGLGVYVPGWLDNQLRTTGAQFYCPAGHTQHFDKPPPAPAPDPPARPAAAPSPKRKKAANAETLVLAALVDLGCGTVHDVADDLELAATDVQAVLYGLKDRDMVERTKATTARVAWGYEGSPPSNAFVYRLKV